MLRPRVETFDLVECKTVVVVQLCFKFSGQFDFMSLTIVIDGALQNIRTKFVKTRFRIILNAFCFNVPELLKKFGWFWFFCSVYCHATNKVF